MHINKKANDGLPQKQLIKNRASYLLVARNMNLLRILFVGQGLRTTHLNNQCHLTFHNITKLVS